MSKFNYITATKLKNYLSDDPLLDWLESYGHLHNYSKDPDDPNQDFNLFIQDKQTVFKKNIMSKIESILPVTKIDTCLDVRKKISQTQDYMSPIYLSL